MPYNKAHILETAHLETFAEAVRTELDDLSEADQSLGTQIQALTARYDANVKASTDADADYAAEVVDARVDTWGGEHDSLGANIRHGQQKASDILTAVEESQDTLQEELEALTISRIEEVVGTVDSNERRREAVSCERQERLESDDTLQLQLQRLSEAVLRQSVMLAGIRELLREKKEEE